MTKRRAHGEGSIYQRADGRWVGELELARGPDGKRSRKVVYGASQADVGVKLQNERTKVAGGVDPKARPMTVAAQLEDWFATVAPMKAENTRTVYRWAIAHLNSGLGAVRIDKLTPTVVTRFLNEKTKAGLSPASVNRLRSVLSQALRRAEIDGIIGRNVVELTDAVPLGHTNSRSPRRLHLGLPRVKGTSELACSMSRSGRMNRCPSPIPRSSATMS